MTITEFLQTDERSRIVVATGGYRLYHDNGEWVVEVLQLNHKQSRYPYRGTDEALAVEILQKELEDGSD